MRRSSTIALAVTLGTTLLVGSAPAASAQPERYSARSYNAFWHSTRRVDANTYLKITWYAGVYEQAGGFWSDLYRYVERCERRPGRDRCRSGPFMVGVIEELGRGSFTLEPDLELGAFEATYPMEIYDNGHERRVGRIHISVDLVGTGTLSTTREVYEYDDGCTRVRYSGRSEYRQAIASGMLTFRRTGKTLPLRDTEDANMSQGESMSITHEC
ncbi:MAG TPA: hypothetical protein VF351_08115 [Actinomycetota bacterium]